MTIPKAYLGQDFAEIKRECLRERRLFIDDTFSIENERSFAVFNHQQLSIEWRRASEIFSEPKFFVNEANPNDINQGVIGDCWFIAAAIAVAQYKDLLSFVVPDDQSFDPADYCGAFHFRFWRHGEWYDVVIDDYLPVSPYSVSLICTRNVHDTNELWCALLEKAFAKLNSCYEFLDGGLTADGLIDLTGGVNELVHIQPRMDTNNLWKYIKKSNLFKSMMGATVVSQGGYKIGQREPIFENGLVANHAYAITNLFEIDKSRDTHGPIVSCLYTSGVRNCVNSLRLIRLRNPWGFTEWKGRFSDYSDEWSKLTEKHKNDLNALPKDDGEFWMDFDDFVKFFSQVTFVHLNLNTYQNVDKSRMFKWCCKKYDGVIEMNDIDSMNIYPQYLISLNSVDGEDEENKATLIISLLQKDDVQNRLNNNGQYDFKYMKASVYKILENKLNKFTHEKFDLNNSSQVRFVDDTEKFTNSRSFTKRLRLDPGDYVVVPSTLYNEKVTFLLRLFTEFQVGDEDFSLLDTNPQSIIDTNFKPKKDKKKREPNSIKNKNNDKKDTSSSNFYWEDKLNDPNYNPYEDSARSGDFEKFDQQFDDAFYESNVNDVNSNCKNSSTQEKCLVM